ncbi:DNA-binding Xre family transcriptional regulator [Sphingomonas insulae]|nr:DNA-binding Xre family transcriptional regulator [Sphingomonas insulae]
MKRLKVLEEENVRLKWLNAICCSLNFDFFH